MSVTELQTALARQSLNKRIDESAVSSNASEDLQNAIELAELPNGSFAYRLDGAIFGSLDNLISGIQNSSRKSYLKSGQHKEHIQNLADNINAEFQKEKNDLQEQVQAAASSGNMELFRKLRKQQGANLQ